MFWTTVGTEKVEGSGWFKTRKGGLIRMLEGEIKLKFQ